MFGCSYCSCTIFILTLCSFYIQVMLILISLDVQFLHIVFSFGKGSNGQVYSCSGSHHHLPLPVNAIWKTLYCDTWLPIPITMSGKVLRICFIVKDTLDQSEYKVPENPIFHERVEA